MHRLAVVGVSWRHRRSDLLGPLTIPRAEREARLPLLARFLGVSELVYLATCNRVEVAFLTPEGTSLNVIRPRVFEALTGRAPRGHEATSAFRVWQDEGAAEHLFLVAAGLDSARVGEQEVSAQVRDAIELSRALGLLSEELEIVFSEAMKVARRVRPVTEGRVGQVSLAEIVQDRVRERLARTPGTVALVGVSPMTEQTGRVLATFGVPMLVVNRTREKAQALATAIGAEACTLEEFRQSPPTVAALVVAVGGGAAVLNRADLERLAARAPSGEAPLVIDVGVPPAVLPEDAAAADVPYLGMDSITEAAAEDRGRMLVEVAEARTMVDAALTDLRRRSAERFVGPMIAALRSRYRHTANEGVERLFARELAGLGETEREIIRRWAETLARRFAHLPSVGLRDLVFRAGPSAALAFFEASEPELIRTAQAAGAQVETFADLELGE